MPVLALVLLERPAQALELLQLLAQPPDERVDALLLLTPQPLGVLLLLPWLLALLVEDARPGRYAPVVLWPAPLPAARPP